MLCKISRHFAWGHGHLHRSESLHDTNGLQSLRCAIGTVYWSDTESIGVETRTEGDTYCEYPLDTGSGDRTGSETFASSPYEFSE